MTTAHEGAMVDDFRARLETLRSGDGRIGMGRIFALAREQMGMEAEQIERLLETHATRLAW